MLTLEEFCDAAKLSLTNDRESWTVEDNMGSYLRYIVIFFKGKEFCKAFLVDGKEEITTATLAGKDLTGEELYAIRHFNKFLSEVFSEYIPKRSPLFEDIFS